jgi:hypothetical protein
MYGASSLPIFFNNNNNGEATLLKIKKIGFNFLFSTLFHLFTDSCYKTAFFFFSLGLLFSLCGIKGYTNNNI